MQHEELLLGVDKVDNETLYSVLTKYQMLDVFLSGNIPVCPGTVQIQRRRNLEAAGFHVYFQVPSLFHTHHPRCQVGGTHWGATEGLVMIHGTCLSCGFGGVSI